VHVFADSTEALEAIERRAADFDLLLTDQTMPGVTGDVLAERARRVAPDLPVLILTGFSHRLTPERVAEVGATEVLQKPIELAALVEAVASALRTTRAV
jgi:CheY-like chemotaxis protein